MKMFTGFECECCHETFRERDKALSHEAEHFGLSLELYKQWLELERQVEQASHQAGVRHCAETEKCFDMAIANLLEFEKSHNLPERRSKFC